MGTIRRGYWVRIIGKQENFLKINLVTTITRHLYRVLLGTFERFQALILIYPDN
ncbi:hypothetical protein C789_1874 [Microcystis aeruginosa FACHB-905 = DIANCHI905]|nr:hypothetical protein C789_1874 [Microcystis aeruginosa FACHB-905 = DIANCHI905]